MSLSQTLHRLFTSPEPTSLRRIRLENRQYTESAVIDEDLMASITKLNLPVTPRPSTGKVVKRTGKPAYKPDTRRKGGRVVKVMPKQLQRIKEAQEKPVEDD